MERLSAAGFRVIVPDQRGYNLSETPKEVQCYGLDELSKDIVGILDHFGIEQVYLVGHDWGAAVAWTVAIHDTQRVKKLGILNVSHPAVMLKFIGKSPKQMLKSWYIGFFQVPGLADWLMGLGNYAGAVHMLRASGKPTTFSDEDMEEYRKAYANSGGLTGMIHWYRALIRLRPMITRDDPGALRGAVSGDIRVKMPVLILWAKNDVALSYEMAEESLRYCEDCKLVAFEDATHWVQHDEAEAVSQHLLEFFE